MPTGVIANREQEYKKPLPEFEGENLKEGDKNTASGERARRTEPESNDGNNGQGASQGTNQPSNDELKLMVSEVVDKLGPLSDEEIKRIQDWLELGS